MRTPYFNVVIGKDEDITMYIDDFVFEDCLEEDSMLEIVAYPKTGKGVALLDEAVNLDTGTPVKFHFGFLQGVPSLVRNAVVKDVEARYNEQGVRVVIRALSKGVDMKRSTDNKIWKKKTSTSIAKEIADKHGMKFEGDTTSKTWDNVPQGNRSDMDFLNYLASREADGNYVTYVKDDTLYFVKRKLESSSSASFTWNDGRSGIISFEPKQRESTSTKGASSTSINSYDLNKQKVSIEKSDNKTAKDDITLGDVKIKYNGVSGQRIGEWIDKKIVRPETGSDATNLSNSSKKKGQLGLLEASMRLEGNPSIVPNSVITINGVATRYIGNWLVKKVRHTINPTGFITVLELAKNGRKQGGDKATKKNTSKGPDKAESKVKLIKYDGATGKRL